MLKSTTPYPGNTASKLLAFLLLFTYLFNARQHFTLPSWLVVHQHLQLNGQGYWKHLNASKYTFVR